MLKKDHTQLICNIGELTGLFADVSSLEAFLQKIVDMISEHMRCEVCSIYLFYEDTEELILKATKGLSAASIGKVKMKLEEGLTGLALRELRPICEMNAKQNPHFKHFPGIGEERFCSFLAVPIVRGNTRIGVMVVQNAQKDYFQQEDINALRAITSQLANTIETAKLLMVLHEKQQGKEPVPDFKSLKLIQGKVGSEGFAFCEATIFHQDSLDSQIYNEAFGKKYTLQDFYRAVHLSQTELENLQKEIEEQLSDVASLIFTAQILMLKDKGFIDPMVDLIGAGVNPPQAVVTVVKQYIERFQAMSDSYLREKRHDVQDVGQRLLNNLIKRNFSSMKFAGYIIIARELFPSDILKLSSQNVKGIILLSGGVSSHLSILARSLKIPLIIANEQNLLRLKPETKILMDAEIGNIYINPAKEVIRTFKLREETRQKSRKVKETMKEKTYTKDGIPVSIMANINLLSDLKAAKELKAQGIGLYRTEFPFIVRSNFPSEEEQYVIYKRLVEGMPDKEITFRTLDIGGDKVLSYYEYDKEENPFLGMRSIRFSLRHKDIFNQQIRAILRAGVLANVRVMFPMISSLDEFLEAKEEVVKCCRDLKKEKISYKEDIKIGLMIELPAVLEIIDELAKEADFFCIGTNDFIQYMLAVDRTNEKVADLYLPHHPSVLRALKKIIDAAHRYQKDVSICGDMAHNEKCLPFFIGVGIQKVSVDCLYLPKLQNLISSIDSKEAQEQARRILQKNKVSETLAILNKS